MHLFGRIRDHDYYFRLLREEERDAQLFPPNDATRKENRQSSYGRRLAVRLYWMWRKQWDYEQVKRFGSQGRKLFSHGVVSTGSTR